MATGTQFYTDPDNAHSGITPAYDSIWDDTSSVIRGKLTWTYPGTHESLIQSETSGSDYYQLFFQFISDELQGISATLADFNAVICGAEYDFKTDGYLHIVVRKCDSDGSNPVTIDSITDDTELVESDPITYTYEARHVGSADMANQTFNDSDRLVVEVGIKYTNSKTTEKQGKVTASAYYEAYATESDGALGSRSTWISTGDTFTEYVPPITVYPTCQTITYTQYHPIQIGADETYQVPAAMSIAAIQYAPTLTYDYKFTVAAVQSIEVTQYAPGLGLGFIVSAPISIELTQYHPPVVGGDTKHTVAAAMAVALTQYAANSGPVVVHQHPPISIVYSQYAATITSPDAIHVVSAPMSVDFIQNGSFVLYDFDDTLEPVYLFELSGSPDIIVPIWQFSARMRNGQESQLIVWIPGTEYESDIKARSSGEMRIYAAYENDAGVIVSQEIIARADLENIEVKKSPGKETIVLTGFKTISYGGHSRELSGISYRNVSGGQTRVRSSRLNPFLRPGDTVTITDDDISFTADEIVYTIINNRKTMEIAEAVY